MQQTGHTATLSMLHPKEQAKYKKLYYRRRKMQVSQPIATDKMLGRDPQRGDDAMEAQSYEAESRDESKLLFLKIRKKNEIEEAPGTYLFAETIQIHVY